MITTIHQCEHAIWLGLLHKIDQSDLFVLADTFDFKKNYFENRNKIRTKDGWEWIAVPVPSHNHKPMKDIKINYIVNWQKKYLKLLEQNYNNAPYFKKYYDELQYIICKNYEYLRDLNYHLIKKFMEWFDIKIPIILSSELDLNPSLRSSERLLEICQKVKATEYLSGVSGKDYLDLSLFKQANINVKFHEFTCPIYKQVYSPFISNMSSIDYLFNEGNILPWKK